MAEFSPPSAIVSLNKARWGAGIPCLYTHTCTHTQRYTANSQRSPEEEYFLQPWQQVHLTHSNHQTRLTAPLSGANTELQLCCCTNFIPTPALLLHDANKYLPVCCHQHVGGRGDKFWWNVCNLSILFYPWHTCFSLFILLLWFLLLTGPSRHTSLCTPVMWEIWGQPNSTVRVRNVR